MQNAQGEQRPLENAELPSTVFATMPWIGTTPKYTFVPTSAIVSSLAEVGLMPYLATVTKTRIDSKQGLTKHLLRFRQVNSPMLPGGIYPEVVIVNSHDTGSCFSASLGLFRLICKNGMVADYGNFESYRGRHVGITLEAIMLGVNRVVNQFPRLADTVQKMQTVTLNENARMSFAHRASTLRWNESKAPLDATMLLNTRRQEDEEPTLWNVFNTVQENMLQGQCVRTVGPGRGWRRHIISTRSTRAIQSIDTQMELNKGLWNLAAEYAGLV